MTRRRGLGLVGVLIALFVVAGIGFVLIGLARQAGRSSHWFRRAQTAHNLAELGRAEALRVLAQASHPGALGDLEVDPAPWRQLLELLAAGRTGEVELFDSGTPDGLTRPLQLALEAAADDGPALRTRLRILGGEPLWPGMLGGSLPARPGEIRGTTQLLSTATVGGVIEGGVTRSVVFERPYKYQSVLAPLLGRFVLWAEERGDQDPNFVDVRVVDWESGAAEPAAPAQPLVVRAGTLEEGRAAALTPLGTPRIDRSQAAGLPDDLLDRQGWVYLGDSSSEGWQLNLQHGYGPHGETFHLRSAIQSVSLRQDPGTDEQVLQAIDLAIFGNFARCDRAVSQGLMNYFHGVAQNYRPLGLQADMEVVKYIFPRRPDRHAALEEKGMIGFGDLSASALRLFGSPDAAAPTLVFGPVNRGYGRRLFVHWRKDEAGRPEKTEMLLPRAEIRNNRGVLFDALFTQPDDAQTQGTAFDVVAYADSLNAALDTRETGTYGEGGILEREDDPGAPLGRRWSSSLFPGGGTWPAAEDAALENLWFGRLEAPGFYQGELGAGFAAFAEALVAKRTVALSAGEVPRLLEGGRLRVPGVVHVGGPVDLPPIQEVTEGGILVAQGSIRLGGDLLRGPGREPLTLVALEGDIRVGDGARRVEARLVALQGTVHLGASETVVEGGLAGRLLDLAELRDSPARRELVYASDMDPAEPGALAASMRLYLGDFGHAPTRYAAVGGPVD